MTDQLPGHFWLTIDAAPSFHLIIQVIIFNSNNYIVFTGNDFPLVVHLKKGLYTIRVEGNGAISDKVIALNSDQNYFIGRENPGGACRLLQPPKLKSPVPLDEAIYSSTHDYYKSAAINCSQANKFIGLQKNKQALFIFMRFASKERLAALSEAGNNDKLINRFANQFDLINSNGIGVLDVNNTLITRNVTDGWIACNVALASGLYFLVYEGEDPRQVPVYVFESWHTQVFLVLDKEPLFRTLRMFVQKTTIFDPYDPANKFTDLLLSRLQHNNFTLEENLAEAIFRVCENAPMLSLLCAFFLVLNKNVKDKLHDEKIAELMKQLKRVNVRGADRIPDLDALSIIDELCKKNITQLGEADRPLKGIPVLRIGYEAIKKSAVENPDLIRQKSLNDLVAEHLLSDSAFTTFSRIPVNNELVPIVKFNLWNTEGMMPPALSPQKEKLLRAAEVEKTVASIFTEYAFHLFMDDEKRGSYFNWLALQMRDVLLQQQDITVSEMAVKLQVSATTLKRKVDEINEMVVKEFPPVTMNDEASEEALERSKTEVITDYRLEGLYMAASNTRTK
jgi:hypothetical protein